MSYLHNNQNQPACMTRQRIIFQSYKDALFCDAHIEDEFSLADLQAMIDEIHKHYTPPVDIIFRKSGSYSVSTAAQKRLMLKVDEFRNFVYVVDNSQKRASAEYAAVSYMKHYNTEVAESVEEAYEILLSKRA